MNVVCRLQLQYQGGLPILFRIAPKLEQRLAYENGEYSGVSRVCQAWASVGGRQNGRLPPSLEIEPKNKNFLENDVSSSISINWFNSCNDSLFAGKTLILHKSQVHDTGVMQ